MKWLLGAGGLFCGVAGLFQVWHGNDFEGVAMLAFAMSCFNGVKIELITEHILK